MDPNSYPIKHTDNMQQVLFLPQQKLFIRSKEKKKFINKIPLKYNKK